MNYLQINDLLTGAYAEAFAQVEAYGYRKNINSEVFDDRMMQLADTLLTAQKNGMPVEKVCGKNMDAYCAAFYGGIPKKDTWAAIFGTLLGAAVYLLIMETMDFLAMEKGSLLTAQSNVMRYIVMLVLLAVILVVYFCLFLAKPTTEKMKKMHSRTTSLMVGFIGFLCGLGIVFGEELLAWKPLVPSVWLLGGAVSYIVAYFIGWCIVRLRKFGSLKDPDGATNRQFARELRERRTVRNLVHGYERDNARREERGKTPLTAAEQMAKFRRSTMWLTVLAGAFTLLWLTAAVILCITDGWFGVFWLTIAIAIVYLLLFAPNSPIKCRRRILRACDERDMDIFAYGEALLRGDI